MFECVYVCVDGCSVFFNSFYYRTSYVCYTEAKLNIFLWPRSFTSSHTLTQAPLEETVKHQTTERFFDNYCRHICVFITATKRCRHCTP